MLIEIPVDSAEIQNHLDSKDNCRIGHFEWANFRTHPVFEIEVLNDMTIEINPEEYGFVAPEIHEQLETDFKCLNEEFEVVRQKYEDLLSDNTKIIGEKLQLSIELEKIKSSKKPFWRIW